jgi:putative ABC transport system substrate-binding protein
MRRISKGIIALALAVLVVGGWVLWSSLRNEDTPKPVVAVATLMTHPALSELERGMRDELASQGFVDGRTIDFVHRNANGQVQLTSTIANELAAMNPAVTVPITTPMAQAVVQTARGPVVFASVTDPIGARVVTTLAGQPRITGASDAWPYEAQLRLIREITPNVRRIGVFYNPGEAASQTGIREIRRYASELGFTLVEQPVNSTGEMSLAARGLADRVDAFLLSSDNTVISGMAGALRVAIERRIPYYVGDSGTVEKGGLAAVSVGYYQHGRHTGQLIARVLRGETNIPVIVERGEEVSVNLAAAQAMGVTIPPQVLRRATNVYRTMQ